MCLTSGVMCHYGKIKVEGKGKDNNMWYFNLLMDQITSFQRYKPSPSKSSVTELAKLACQGTNG